MDQLGSDFARFISHLLTPETFGLVTALSTIGWQLYKHIQKNLKESYHDSIKPLEEKVDSLSDDIKTLRDNEKGDWSNHLELTRDIQKEVLRLQILEGIESKRLSESEIRYFYDKYRRFGGNSFVTAKVHAYLQELSNKNKSDEKDDDDE